MSERHSFSKTMLSVSKAVTGYTAVSELYTIYAKLVEVAAQHGVTIVRNLVGNYITSLDMAGCSITLVKTDDEILRLYDAPVETPALRWGC
jgi:dihydroxyacetone kinase-like protein